MKPSDTKINHFSDQNLPQSLLSLSRPESEDSLSLLSTKKRLKKEENEVRYQSVLF
jgi:hypothetical protein